MQSGVDLPKTGIGKVEHHDPFSRLEDMYVVGLVRLHVMLSIELHAGSCDDSTPLGTVYLSMKRMRRPLLACHQALGSFIPRNLCMACSVLCLYCDPVGLA